MSTLSFPIDQEIFKEKTGRLCHNLESRFRRILRRYALFHMGYLMLAGVESLCFLLFFPFFMQSHVLAFSLSALFLTAFSYFALRLFLQTKKPERLASLRDLYLESCKSLTHYQEGLPEHHLALANAACKLAANLEDEEFRFYHSPIDWLKVPLERLGSLWHWRDVLSLRELLLLSAVEEYLKIIKCEPTNLEIHAALANAYVMLSNLYRRTTGEWTPPGRNSLEMEARFRAASERAIEEFQILRAYAPNDPWVHTQLAYSYSDLQMPREEIQEYEALLRLRPADLDILFRLGIRYFQQGLNAKGLKVYGELKMKGYPKADELLHFYGVELPSPMAME